MFSEYVFIKTTKPFQTNRSSFNRHHFVTVKLPGSLVMVSGLCHEDMAADIQFQHLREVNMFQLPRYLVKSFLLLAKLVRLPLQNIVDVINMLVKFLKGSIAG